MQTIEPATSHWSVSWRTSSVVCSRWCCKIDHGHAGQSSLAAFFWAHPVQASDDGVLATARSRLTVLIQRPSSLGGFPVAATSAVRVFAAARRAVHSSSDCWRPSVRCCRSDALEQSATWRDWLCVTDIILPETENFCFLYHFRDYIFLFSGPWGFYLGHFKKFLMYVCMYECKR